MTRRLKRLSLNEHIILGKDLSKMRTSCMAMFVKLETAYGLGQREGRAAGGLLKAIDQLRCVLDSAVFREHVEAVPTIYYRNRKHLHYCATPDCGELFGSGNDDECRTDEDHGHAQCEACLREQDERDGPAA